jgi:hypothetical protein
MAKYFTLLLPLCALVAAPLHADDTATYAIGAEWTAAPANSDADAFFSGAQRVIRGATYGPFRVLDERRVALVDATDAGSPQAFAALLRDHPDVATLEMVDCPGTYDDLANLVLGRMIRRAGLATHVPAEGSVRSGAVELFLAGSSRRIDDGAEFAVHAWEDGYGREATDFSATSPENRKYLNYYREMGMNEAQASAFYAMTNSVPFERARWLDADEMRHWLPEVQAEIAATKAAGEPQDGPRLAYLDLSALLF